MNIEDASGDMSVTGLRAIVANACVCDDELKRPNFTVIDTGQSFSKSSIFFNLPPKAPTAFPGVLPAGMENAGLVLFNRKGEKLTVNLLDYDTELRDEL